MDTVFKILYSYTSLFDQEKEWLSLLGIRL